MQKIVDDFNKNVFKQSEKTKPEIRMLDIQSEVGELAKEILKSTNYGSKQFEITNNFKMEYGDVLYALLSLANEVEVDSSECLNKAIEKYTERINKKKDIGSGN